MARGGLAKQMQDQIITLKAQGKTITAIAMALNLSRNTVKKYLRQPAPPQVEESWASSLDWDHIAKLVAKGVTLKQLADDYAPTHISYWTFRRQVVKRYQSQTEKSVSVRQEHEPGRTTQIDFADGIPVVDARTGDKIKTQLFCSVLPFSSKIYAEFTLDQRQPSFLGAQERMWRFYGGVTPYVVIDNLKAGVVKAHRYDPVVNPTYSDFANHYGFAVLPARPYHPKDKAAVEATIGVLQKTFYQEVRERTFYSLTELNEMLREFLERLNSKIMKDYGVSRNDRFSLEAGELLALPTAAYELADWRDAKVHPDCCIQLQKCLYSVPYQYVGQTVKVKYGLKLVVIYSAELEVIARHPRLQQAGKSSIIDGHYPEYKLQLSRYEMQQIRRRSRQIGDKTEALVDTLFSSSRPLRHLRRLQGLMRLFDKGVVSRDAIEYAATQALSFKRYHLSYLESCAKSFDQTKRLHVISAPKREADEVYLHTNLQGEE